MKDTIEHWLFARDVSINGNKLPKFYINDLHKIIKLKKAHYFADSSRDVHNSGNLARGIFIGLLKAFGTGNRGQRAIGGAGYDLLIQAW